MKKIHLIRAVKIFINLIILFMILNGGSIIVEKSYLVLFRPDEIEPIRLEIPWIHPAEDVTIMFHKDLLEKNPDINQTVSKNILIHNIIRRILTLTLVILILLQLKALILSINHQTFFEPRNIHMIRTLSILVILWVLKNFIIYHLIPFFIPLELMYETINFIALGESFFSSMMISIDYKMLFFSIILYIVSISFKEGYQLKEQSDLTI